MNNGGNFIMTEACAALSLHQPMYCRFSNGKTRVQNTHSFFSVYVNLPAFEKRARPMQRSHFPFFHTLCWLFFLSTGNISALYAQINCDTTFSAKQLVDSFLLGKDIRAANITFTGPKVGIAYFSNETNAVGIQEGILLSTGSVFNANGPNNSPYITTSFMDPTLKKRPKGDRDLNKICRSVTYDVSILEFDFIPFNNHISFSYAFGSEEYPEYVGSRYNDVFGFIIDGEKLNNKNLAVIPKTVLPVTINTINDKDNEGYYIDNDYFKKVELKKNLPGQKKNKKPNYTLSDTYEINKKKLKKLNQNLINSVQYDGMTVVLTASAYVVPFKKYHMKIAIGDVGDPQYDSGVFLERGSFTSKKDPAQTKFKDYPDLSATMNFDSIFGLQTLVSQATKDSLLKEEAAYQRFNVTNINFETASYIIPDTAKDELKGLTSYLKEHTRFKCELYGYTDNQGSKKYNQRLSESRANAVMSFLVASGVPPTKIEIAGYNFENPIADNSNERGRAMNRRVEIILVEE